MTAKEIAKLKRRLKFGPKMTRKERVEYLTRLIHCWAKSQGTC